jgi:hypothetical protein
MPRKDKLVIAFTVLICLVGPYLTYKRIETGLNKDFILDKTGLLDCELPGEDLALIFLGQVAMLITAQVAMVALSALLIREHKRRKKLESRN